MNQPLTDDDFFAAGKALLEQQPFSVGIGAELLICTRKEVVIRVKMRDDLRQHHGFAHGGLLATLADISVSYAAAVALEAANVLTAEIKINYIRPASGDTLIARSAPLGATRRQGVARCEIYSVQDGEETLCAAAQGSVTHAQVDLSNNA